MILDQDAAILSKKILDVGGSLHFWEKIGVDLDTCDITIINKTVDGQSSDSRGGSDDKRIQVYDGQRIPFADKHFDWVICNSVIEHVPVAARANLVKEILRVGKRYIVQTPAFAFPIEPHLVFPFLHWMPLRTRYVMARFGLWSLLYRRTADEIVNYVDEVSLLRRAEVRQYFPNATIHVERMFFLPKSYLAIGQDMEPSNAAPR